MKDIKDMIYNSIQKKYDILSKRFTLLEKDHTNLIKENHDLIKKKKEDEKTIQNLGGDAANPFVLFPETVEIYKTAQKAKAEHVKKHRDNQAKREKENPALAKKLQSFLKGEQLFRLRLLIVQ